MQIEVYNSLGSGPTELAAFDNALVRAGIANFNLIRLSSVIPPGSTVVIPKSPQPVTGQWGDRLYVVYARQFASIHGVQAWAGVGWTQEADTGKGLFVEHEGLTEQQVRGDIKASLEAMVPQRSGDFGPVQMHIIGGTYQTQPICALTIAVYQADGWKAA